MARKIKPLPKNGYDIDSEAINPPYLASGGKPALERHPFVSNRGTNYSFQDDTVKDISVNLQDIDNAMLFYFNDTIKPTIVQEGNRVAVRTIYGTPERWKSVQQDGFLRDGNGQITIPIIMLRRNSTEKTRGLGNKIDGNTIALYQIVGTKYNPRNAYDKFSVLNGRIPSQQYYISTVPDYVTLTYECVIFTNYIEQNNKIVEAMEFASDSYWGDLNRFKFRASIDSFSHSTIIENGTDRVAKSTFNITVSGYIIPDTISKDLATVRSKFFTKSQIVFDMEIIDSNGATTNIDLLKVVNPSPASNGADSTSFIGGGINVTNNNYLIAAAAAADLTYLNTNKELIADIINTNTATFTGAALLQPPAGSTLPPTSVINFTFYLNGQYISSTYVTITSVSGGVTFTFDTVALGYNLDSNDGVKAIGKFQ